MRGEPSTSELQALAARQQQQLDNQARLIAAREHRLRQVNASTSIYKRLRETNCYSCCFAVKELRLA